MELTDRTKEFVAEIVASYVGANTIAASDLPDLIKIVHRSLLGADQSNEAEAAVAVAKRTPAQIRRSISHDAIISFEDGKPYRSMKRHLARYGLTPQEYREKWGLPKDYPIVAPGYSAARSEMAKRLGLGRAAAAAPKSRRGRGGRASAAAQEATTPAADVTTKAKPGRRKRAPAS
jgi:predicted transcriptional regulator